MNPRPPRFTRTDPLLPYPTLFRSAEPVQPPAAEGDLRTEQHDKRAHDRDRAVARTDAQPHPVEHRDADHGVAERSEEHTSELQQQMSHSFAAFRLKKKNNTRTTTYTATNQQNIQ